MTPFPCADKSWDFKTPQLIRLISKVMEFLMHGSQSNQKGQINAVC
ncbi:hypothetical protein VCHA50O413_40350 [Vibrio chagasii]|nr:hypothetical protein VCHA27O13_20055 [Vibrio chagasii]CAH6809506.1 hypothetical protein VCHA35P150_110205 [Vibrio chagasii]CAH6815218.1 hypothetical protein VCHA35O135_130168 [Vibrio chagasii]CAH6869384.1 hypothetical protein VCHA36O163_220051 [Vibrio chagasii]CAH6872387.1 hypothetical protein VCHA31O71_220051 [Vibrio chagasii]